MKNKLTFILLSIASATFLFSVSSCNESEEKKLEGKWQLRQHEMPDGSIVKSDSIFYNFQKGSYSAICILNYGGYLSFFGNYTLKDNKISIILLPDYEGPEYDKYMNWNDHQRIFEINELTSDKLILSCNDTISIFRKY